MITADRIKLIEELGFKKSSLSLLQKYIELLWSANEDLNLVSRKMSPQDLIDNHVIDSLLPLDFFPQNIKTVADFGSGGGLPALIYALQFPQIQFHLFEKSPKKQIFLNECKAIAPNIIVNSEIPAELQQIDLITARGFKPLDVILDMSRNYFQNKGKYFLFKGRLEKINEEQTLALKKFKNLKIDVLSLKSPILEVERHLVKINF